MTTLSGVSTTRCHSSGDTPFPLTPHTLVTPLFPLTPHTLVTPLFPLTPHTLVTALPRCPRVTPLPSVPIIVVNRTHPEQRADPFTPAGVVACLLRLGWLIRRDEQDTHEMFYVLVSTLQEEPPPLAFSADGLRAGDGPVEADTGEALVDWGALGARMRGDARDICGAGVPGGGGAERRRGGRKTRREDGAGRVVGQNGAVIVRPENGGGVGAVSGASKDSNAGVCDTGAGSVPRENGDSASMPDSGDGRAASQVPDERGDTAEVSNSADDPACVDQTPPPRTSPTHCHSTEPSPTANGRPEVGSQQEVTNRESGATVDGPTSVNGPAVAGCPAAAACLEAAGRPTPDVSSRPSAARSPPEGLASPVSPSASPVSPSASPVSPVVSPPVSGVVGRRQLRGVVHRVHAAGAPSWRGLAGPLRSPFTGTVSTQLVCQACGHKVRPHQAGLPGLRTQGEAPPGWSARPADTR